MIDFTSVPGLVTRRITLYTRDDTKSRPTGITNDKRLDKGFDGVVLFPIKSDILIVSYIRIIKHHSGKSWHTDSKAKDPLTTYLNLPLYLSSVLLEAHSSDRLDAVRQEICRGGQWRVTCNNRKFDRPYTYSITTTNVSYDSPTEAAWTVWFTHRLLFINVTFVDFIMARSDQVLVHKSSEDYETIATSNFGAKKSYDR